MKEDTQPIGQWLSRRDFLKVIGVTALGTAMLTTGLGCVGCASKKSDYEIHRDNYVIAYQELSRPKIEELLGAENYDRCCTAMLRAYDSFAPQLPTFEDDKNRDQFYRSAPFMLSLYLTLLGEFAYRQDKALDLLRKITLFKVRVDWEKNYPVSKFFYANLAKSKFLLNLGKKRFEEYQDEEYGWAAEFPESDAYLAIDFTRCGLVDWFKDQGVPEIAPIGCEGDLIVAEYYQGLEFIRTKTIANGDEYCDFRFVKEQT
jgi:hypothetical protein